MEAIVRKPFQGVTNVVRFNWHFYIIAVVASGLLLFLTTYLSHNFSLIISTSAILIVSTTLISLGVSYYVYDHSGLYTLDWLDDLHVDLGARIVNINAGFDETSLLIKKKYSEIDLTVFDFYDPENHTEVSIERARQAYEAYPGTRRISTTQVPLEKSSIDFIFNIFSLHEIRNNTERVALLNQLNESLKPGGKCVVVEHLRDFSNFVAYNVGVFHFYPRHQWESNFKQAGLKLEKEIKITIFVSVFILGKINGDTP